jgi:hypothetical protein
MLNKLLAEEYWKLIVQKALEFGWLHTYVFSNFSGTQSSSDTHSSSIKFKSRNHIFFNALRA